MPWIQSYTPVSGSIGMSALVAAIPLVVIFFCLAGLKMKAHKAGLLAVTAAMAIAIGVWGMPAKLAGLATLQGAAFGIFPVFYIVVTTIFLYNITVKGGQFEVLRASLAGVTGDRRLQALLIAFCFGAFIEGAAGFGTPVAIAGATLVGLGFRPFYAAGLCLVANSAPVAFGAIGIPVVALAGVMGYDHAGLMKLSTMIGRQLPFVSLFIPFYIIFIMVGWKKTIEVLPAILTCGVTFAVTQWASASFLGPYLPDILASLFSIVALVLLLKVWHPKETWTFDHEPEFAGKIEHSYTGAEVFRAWAPYLALTVMVLLWGIPGLKPLLNKGTVVVPITGLNNKIAKKVSTPEDNLKKAAVVTAEIDRQVALLSTTNARQVVLAGKLSELRTAEQQLVAVDNGLTGKGAILTDERLAAFDTVAKKRAEIQKMAKELAGASANQGGTAMAHAAVAPVPASDQFKPLDKDLADQLPVKVPAKFALNFMSAAGSAILIAAIISAIICGIGFGDFFKLFGKTLYDLRYPALTIAAVVGLAFIMNNSGMTTSLGMAFTKTGRLFPFLSPFLGALGVFLTGSDTASNVLFGGFQKVTAEQLGLHPVLTAAANSSGGVMGKMISPQSIAVATAATGLQGEEGNLFRFTLKHSLLLTTIVGVIVLLQAYVVPWMIPH